MYMYVLAVTTQNTLCVLQRVAGMFSRYRINIEQVNISRYTNKLSYWNIVFYSHDETVDLLVKQLAKIIEVVEIKIIDQVELSIEDKIKIEGVN